MNSLQITNIVRNDKNINHIFKGVIPWDFLPNYKIFQRPAAYIVNTDKSDKSGSHWVLMILYNDDKSIFFDSYGFSPQSELFNINFMRFLKRNSNNIAFQNRQIQDTTSSYCGHYCIFMLYHLSSGMSYENALTYFDDDFKRNDSIVDSFVKCRIKHLKFRNTQTCISCCQICQPINKESYISY